jgi:hypothetical protein
VPPEDDEKYDEKEKEYVPVKPGQTQLLLPPLLGAFGEPQYLEPPRRSSRKKKAPIYLSLDPEEVRRSPRCDQHYPLEEDDASRSPMLTYAATLTTTTTAPEHHSTVASPPPYTLYLQLYPSHTATSTTTETAITQSQPVLQSVLAVGEALSIVMQRLSDKSSARARTDARIALKAKKELEAALSKT